MPLDEFRKEAKKHLEDILISIKAKNKVVTRNVNTSKKRGGVNKKAQLTPRGQLHNETIYGKIRQAVFKEEKIGPSFTSEKIATVASDQYRTALMRRLAEFGGDPKKAFVKLDENPIWLNREKGISINHHVAIYKDGDGNLQEQVVSFLDAVTRVNLGMPVIDRDYNKEEGWKFMFTMKQNEYFVFPNPSTGFDPNEIDLMDPENYSIISPNLFRVQKIASKNYFFRHHLETTVIEDKQLINLTYKPQLGLRGIKGIVKVRINHLGQIVQVGE